MSKKASGGTVRKSEEPFALDAIQILTLGGLTTQYNFAIQSFNHWLLYAAPVRRQWAGLPSYTGKASLWHLLSPVPQTT